MIEAIRLRTEYMYNPLGLGITSPRVMWNVKGAKKQRAFELTYCMNEGRWENVAKTYSDTMYYDFDVIFRSRDHVSWKIRLFDENDTPGPWSEPQSFEMGLLDLSDWHAKWIMGDFDHSPKKDVRYPVDCFRKMFSIDKVPAKARLYITSCGLYEVLINDKKVGEGVLTPGSTAFQKRVNCQTYDVTEMIKVDETNTLKIELADGFYASKTGVFNKSKIYGFEPKVIAQLEISFFDGRTMTVITDESFDWSNDGPIIFADMKDGEIVDFSKSATYSGRARVTAYEGIISNSDSCLAKEQETFAPASIITCPDGNTVLDYGQNIAGYLAFDSITLSKSEKMSFICGEKLNEDGNFTQLNIKYNDGDYDKGHFQRIDIIGDGKVHDYRTKFSIMGFRYVLVKGISQETDLNRIKAVAVYSDMETTVEFLCSDEKVNKIVENTLWSMKGNFMDIPTDCPTRERAGWTGDAQLFFNTGNILMDQAAFFRKWLRDVVDCQSANGMVYNISPSMPSGNRLLNWVSMEGSCGWGDALIMIPYRYWKRYGDSRLIEDLWEPITKCFEFYMSRMGRFVPGSGLDRKSPHRNFVCGKGRGFGEWTEPEDCALPKTEMLKPLCEENTAYLAYDAQLMAQMARCIGREREADKYETLSVNIKKAYEYYFLKDAFVEENRECKVVRPCGLDLVSEETKRKLREKLAIMNRRRNYKVGTGFLSTPFLLKELTAAGYSDEAWKILVNPEIGWMKEINEGATTVWENWTDDASLNHYSKGACCEWLFEDICGLKVSDRNHFVIKPHIVSELLFAELSYNSVYGIVTVGWKRTENGIDYNIVIPDNCTAEIIYEQ